MESLKELVLEISRHTEHLRLTVTETPSVADIRADIARLSVLLEEIEDALPDIDEGLVLRPEIKDRLLKSGSKPRESLLSEEQMRKKLEVESR